MGSRPKCGRLCRLLWPACTLLLALAPVMAAGQEPAAAPPRINPQAQEVLDKTVQAMGGSAFLQAKSLTTRGRIFAIDEGVTAGFARFESTVEYPDKRRFAYGKDNAVVLINNGERGWQLDRYGIIRQPPQQVRRWKAATRYSLENLLRKLIHELDLLIQDGGMDFTDNLPARVVEMVDGRQVRIKLFVHKANFLPIRVSYRLQNPDTREWEEFAEVYGDYRKIQGVQTPMHITRFRNGARYGEIFRNVAEYNTNYPADYFRPSA